VNAAISKALQLRWNLGIGKTMRLIENRFPEIFRFPTAILGFYPIFFSNLTSAISPKTRQRIHRDTSCSKGKRAPKLQAPF
jgi:hypothetical protein